LMRQDFLDQVGMLDESYFMYAEETDLCFRAHRAGWEVHYAPVGEIVHTGGGSSRLAKEKNFIEFRRSILRFFSKHRGRLAAEAARALLMLFLLVRIPYWWIRSLWGADRDIGREQLSNYRAGLRYLARPLRTILNVDLPT
jgi:GT2 family glycosyltransferase